MALSQKHFGKSLVPWFNSGEWHIVMEKIYGSNSTNASQREALDVLKVWKARTRLLPCGVEGTYIILQAMLVNRELYDIYNLQLVLSSAVMRFLNICAAYNKFQGTFYQTAKQMQLPDWLIDMRHDVAHGSNLPSRDLLECALSYCFDWLYREYWLPHSSQMHDFIDTPNISTLRSEQFQSKMEAVLVDYTYITLVLLPHWNYTTIANIENDEFKNYIIEQVHGIARHGHIDESTSIKQLLGSLWMHIKMLLEEYNDVEDEHQIFVHILVNGGAFLGTFEDTDQVFTDVYPKHLPRDFVFLWEKLLKKMHKLGMLDVFIKHLLNIVSKANETHKRKWFVALWLQTIGKALYKCAVAEEIWKGLKKHRYTDKSNKYINKMLQDKCEQQSPQLKDVLNLNFLSHIPNILKDQQTFKQKILDNPNEYMHLFITEFLQVNKSFKSTMEQIKELVNTFVTDENESLDYSKIFSLEDLNAETEEDNYKNGLNGNVTDMQTEVLVHEENNLGSPSTCIWEKVIGMSFDQCPLGILPFQPVTANPMF